ncbi:Thiol-disulfide isomerase or thioredoxin [Mucilaginibacter gossypiicola]|uniref:Thiol-disulfide isomerase or thioredoxin n=1 Tax=Mucilaginibacter gossypiicola TaxID=551995 RepID=A0A1H8D1X0_9SPHI|nr:TlpA disulfide reductase family protein [Mucilaginibacter gossypiicola]SEN01421.1 Thiol-disulfide isomerase or thioredoxin [Mucilaginibacter gossypiicola]
MKKLTILIVMASYCLYFPAFSQTNPQKKYLHIGDKIPDLIITNLINSKKKILELSKSRGKVVILDFWNTYCSSCIDGFEELDSLQKAYPDQLQVLLVNAGGDTKRTVDIVIKRTKAWSSHGFDLPIVFPDSVVHPYFKFRPVPHTIWIDKNGFIIGITGKKEVNPKNVAKAISGEKLTMEEKID